MDDEVGAIEQGLEPALISGEFQRLRHLPLGVGEHPVGRDDDAALDLQRCRADVRHIDPYSEMVCTTDDTGRVETVGSLASFRSASSYCASVCTGTFGFIATTL